MNKLNWEDFKSLLLEKYSPFFIKFEDKDMIILQAAEETDTYITELYKENAFGKFNTGKKSALWQSRIQDFENNWRIKSGLNLARRSDDGLITHYSSPRPMDTTTFFTGVGDDVSTTEASGIGNGTSLCFSLAASASSQVKELQFQEDVYIKDGFMVAKNAPFGSSVDIEVKHPLYGVIGRFARKVSLYGDYPIYLNSEDRALLPKGLILKITIHNSDPDTCPEDDPKVAFKAVGRVELFRKTTA